MFSFPTDTAGFNCLLSPSSLNSFAERRRACCAADTLASLATQQPAALPSSPAAQPDLAHSMPQVSVQIKSKIGKVLAAPSLPDTATVRELKKAVHAANKKLQPSRQRLTLPLPAGSAPQAKPVVLEDSKTLAEYGIKDGAVVNIKDLGPQIGYSTVFFWEYFGPLAVYPLFYFLPQILYPGVTLPAQRPLVQTLALAYWSFHYAKRIFETFFVHKFGHETMPLANLMRNCAYYWGFAAYVSYFNNHPLYTAPAVHQSLIALGLAMLCQLGNLRCHIILSGLRKPGEKGYQIPRGFLFNFITCANYTCEVLGWVFFTVAVQAVPAGLFTIIGAAQMAQWAVQKHKRLQKVFDGKEGRAKYPRRWIMLPPFF